MLGTLIRENLAAAALNKMLVSLLRGEPVGETKDPAPLDEEVTTDLPVDSPTEDQ